STVVSDAHQRRRRYDYEVASPRRRDDGNARLGNGVRPDHAFASRLAGARRAQSRRTRDEHDRSRRLEEYTLGHGEDPRAAARSGLAHPAAASPQGTLAGDASA